MIDGFEWYCFNCNQCVHRAELSLLDPSDIIEELPKIFDAFDKDMDARTCPNCATVHPGKGKPPEGWVEL